MQNRVVCAATHGHGVIWAWPAARGHDWNYGLATALICVDPMVPVTTENCEDIVTQSWWYPSLIATLGRTVPSVPYQLQCLREQVLPRAMM